MAILTPMHGPCAIMFGSQHVVFSAAGLPGTGRHLLVTVVICTVPVLKHPPHQPGSHAGSDAAADSNASWQASKDTVQACLALASSEPGCWEHVAGALCEDMLSNLGQASLLSMLW